MANNSVDYDQIASAYDQRFITDKPSPRGLALLNLARNLRASHVLEVGCGTGYWLHVLTPVTHNLVGLDPSKGMLNQALAKQTLAGLIQGVASCLPFKDDYFDLVFSVNAIHHFANPPTFIKEAFRVLRSAGTLAVVGSDRPSCRDSWYGYQFFVGTYEVDLKRFPSFVSIAEWMHSAGFRDIKLEEVEHIVDHKHGHGVLKDPYLQKDACSQLTLLTDEAYERGLRRIEAALRKAEEKEETLLFPSEFKIMMLSGIKA